MVLKPEFRLTEAEKANFNRTTMTQLYDGILGQHPDLPQESMVRIMSKTLYGEPLAIVLSDAVSPESRGAAGDREGQPPQYAGYVGLEGYGVDGAAGGQEEYGDDAGKEQCYRDWQFVEERIRASDEASGSSRSPRNPASRGRKSWASAVSMALTARFIRTTRTGSWCIISGRMIMSMTKWQRPFANGRLQHAVPDAEFPTV